jgi:hypothetical protein
VQTVEACRPPAEVEARIGAVLPHRGSAERLDVWADLVLHRSQATVDPGLDGPNPWLPEVWLVAAVNSEVGRRVALGQARLGDGGNVSWVFEGVDVGAAVRAGGLVHLRVEVEGLRTYSTVWTFGGDGRVGTALPAPLRPLGHCG